MERPVMVLPFGERFGNRDGADSLFGGRGGGGGSGGGRGGCGARGGLRCGLGGGLCVGHVAGDGVGGDGILDIGGHAEEARHAVGGNVGDGFSRLQMAEGVDVDFVGAEVVGDDDDAIHLEGGVDVLGEEIKIAVGHADAGGHVHGARVAARAAEEGEEFALVIEHLDILKCVINHVELVIRVDGHELGADKLPGPGAQPADLGDECAVVIEFLDEATDDVVDEEIALCVDGDAHGATEFAMARAAGFTDGVQLFSGDAVEDANGVGVHVGDVELVLVDRDADGVEFGEGEFAGVLVIGVVGEDGIQAGVGDIFEAIGGDGDVDGFLEGDLAGAAEDTDFLLRRSRMLTQSAVASQT